jgi:hypothetical protein
MAQAFQMEPYRLFDFDAYLLIERVTWMNGRYGGRSGWRPPGG